MTKIEDKIIADQQMAVINYKGHVEDMSILLAQLMGWAEVNNVKVTGPPFAIYYNRSMSVKPDKMIYDMGIPVKTDSDGTDKIHVVELLEHRVLSILHEGSYKTLEKSYKQLAEYSIKYNYDIIGSPKEVYLNSPHEVIEDDLLTEIQFPVIKM
jgi:effector-binding domain-containing protein